MNSALPSAPGVVYTEVNGLRLFKCTALGATITDRACLENYRAAKSSLRVNYRPHLHHCVGCPIGAAHCGEKPRARASTFCPRCHRSDLRFIPSAGLCVSCYNRRGELKRGKNARGNPPIELLQRAPVPHSVCFVYEGRRVQYNRLSVDHVEPMLAALLVAQNPESIMFTFGRPDLEPVDNGPAPGWQRPNAVMERRALERTKKRRESKKRCGMS